MSDFIEQLEQDLIVAARRLRDHGSVGAPDRRRGFARRARLRGRDGCWRRSSRCWWPAARRRPRSRCLAARRPCRA